MDGRVLTMAAMERRRSLRRNPSVDEPLSQARLRAGRELAVIDVSSAGALVEGVTRLLPGTHVDLHIVTRDGRTLVRSRVVRAYVCHVDVAMVRYRGALVFDRPLDTGVAGYAIPGVLADAPLAAGKPYPDPCAQPTVDQEHALSVQEFSSRPSLASSLE
jgi:hypothetical protein